MDNHEQALCLAIALHECPRDTYYHTIRGFLEAQSNATDDVRFMAEAFEYAKIDLGVEGSGIMHLDPSTWYGAYTIVGKAYDAGYAWDASKFQYYAFRNEGWYRP